MTAIDFTYLDQFEIIDLTRPMEEGMTVWPTDPPFAMKAVEDRAKGDEFTHYQLSFDEHCGTHMDAPLHKVTSGTGIDALPLQRCCGRALTIHATETKTGTVLTKTYIQTWEKNHQPIQADDIVLLHFGRADLLQPWPGLSADAATYLADKKIRAVGTDALDIDIEGDPAFPAHEILLQAGIPIVETLTNLAALPDESLFLALPLKIKNGSGSPVRAVAWTKRSK